MERKNMYMAIAAVVCLVLILIAYEKGWLNEIVPASWQKHKAAFTASPLPAPVAEEAAY